LVIDPSPSAEFDPKYLEHKQAKIFGCEGSINAWECCENRSPKPNGNYRCSGGHLHCGYDNPNLDDSLRIAKAFDLFLGVPSILYDEDKERRKMYGKAGEIRFPKFGLEFRVLSNFWIFNDNLIEWVFNNVHNAIDFINNNKNFDKLIEKEKENIVSCINTQDKELAEKLIKKYKIPVPDLNKKKDKNSAFAKFNESYIKDLMQDIYLEPEARIYNPVRFFDGVVPPVEPLVINNDVEFREANEIERRQQEAMQNILEHHRARMRDLEDL